MTTLGYVDLRTGIRPLGALPAETVPAKARRGTSNGGSRGNVEDRRRRRVWLVATYRADVDLDGLLTVSLGTGETCCRCYRCGKLLTVSTVTVDRIIPGCKGGTYRRNNIRPACAYCNSETGGSVRS